MKLASIIDEDLIVCGMKEDTREALYGRLIDKIKQQVTVDFDRNDLLRELISREDAMMMPYEGVALPHMRAPVFSDLVIAIGILDRPVKIKAGDPAPCGIIVMSLISANTSDLYLKALAAFSRYLINPENQALVMAAESPRQIRDYLGDINLKNEITAEDVMNHHFTALRQDSLVAEALDVFSRQNAEQLPVLDGNGRLVGVLEGAEIIKRYVPNVFFMLDNLKFLTSFEPFEKIFKDEHKVAVRDFMRPVSGMIPPETPLIQATIALVKKEEKELYVIDSDDRLLGVVSIRELIHKVLRG